MVLRAFLCVCRKVDVFESVSNAPSRLGLKALSLRAEILCYFFYRLMANPGVDTRLEPSTLQLVKISWRLQLGHRLHISGLSGALLGGRKTVVC